MSLFHHKTQFWHVIDGERIQCDLCPRFCRLKPEQRGLCFVRQNIDGQLMLTSYGRSSGFCIDPVEKKPLNHFLPGTPVMSFGTAGCNLSCKFCQNWDISKSKEMDKLASYATPEKIAQVAEAYNCRSVAFTYNDPVIFHEYAIDVAKACRAKDIRTIAVTAGYICPQPREVFFSHMDAANVDLKSFSEKFYYKLTGSHLQPVLETLVYLKKQTKIWLELTCLLIPGCNDSSREIDQMSRWIVDKLGRDVPLHFTAFHPDWKMKDIPPTSLQTLLDAREISINNGIRYVYCGNVQHSDSQTTYCYQCNNKLIERDWYHITGWKLKEEGCCGYCGASQAGIFEATAGSWGGKRVPVNFSL